MSYPYVVGEFETVEQLLTGKSIARFGDGELKLMGGGDQIREPHNPALAEELRQILTSPHPSCLVGIPTMDKRGPKYGSWETHIRRFSELLNHGMQYYSAFVTRPDSAPWIFTREYSESVCQLWAGKRVSIVCEADNKILKLVKRAARKVMHTPCPHRETYAVINDIEGRLVKERPDIAVLSCGPAATCLAHRLSVNGFQALDFGSMGGFMLKALAIEVGSAQIFAIRREEDEARGALTARLRAAGFDVVFSSEEKGA